MYTEHYDHWFKANKNFATPLTEWNKATAEICQRAAQKNLELIGDNFSLLSDQLKRFTSIRKPEELVTLQKECLAENMNAAAECLQKIMHISMENMEEFTKLCGQTREHVTPGKSADRK